MHWRLTCHKLDDAGSWQIYVSDFLVSWMSTYRDVFLVNRRCGFVNNVAVLMRLWQATTAAAAGDMVSPRSVQCAGIRGSGSNVRCEIQQADLDLLPGRCLQQPRLSPRTAVRSHVRRSIDAGSGDVQWIRCNGHGTWTIFFDNLSSETRTPSMISDLFRYYTRPYIIVIYLITVTFKMDLQVKFIWSPTGDRFA